jgi:hypothetical protein
MVMSMDVGAMDLAYERPHDENARDCRRQGPARGVA